MEESILTSIKGMLGISKEYDHFDATIVSHINSVFMTLKQLGVGPLEGFAIEDDSVYWYEFISEETSFQAVKSYMYAKVRLLFDPPTNSALIESLNRQIAEFEWRLNVEAETPTTE